MSNSSYCSCTHLASLQLFTAAGSANIVLCLRSLTDAAGASPSKYSRQYVRIPVESGQAVSPCRERDPELDKVLYSGLEVFLTADGVLTL